MKQAVIFFCLVQFQAFSQGIVFFEGNISSLKEEARKQNKLIFIDCYTTWCGPCKWLAKNVFTNVKVGDFYNQHFINYSLDMEKGEGKEFAKKYGISAYPTLLFIDYKGEIQHRYVGACDTATFIGVGKQALDTLNNFGFLLRSYQNGNRKPDFLAKYALACASVYYPYNIQEYFTTQCDTCLFSEMNFQIMERYQPNIQSREYTFVLQHADEFIRKYGFDRTYNFLCSTLIKTLYAQMNQKDFKAEKYLNEYLKSLTIKHLDFWKTAFITEFYGYYKVKQYSTFISQLNNYLEEAYKIPDYFEKALHIAIEGVKNKVADEALNKQFIEIIHKYEKNLNNLSIILSIIEIGIKAKDKNYSVRMLQVAKPLITTEQQQKEYNRLEKMVNEL